MMTVEPNGDGGVRVRQVFSHPRVYLDHWAVRKFSSDLGMQDRFVDALHASGGTWLVSHLNLSEFCAMTDTASADAAEALMARCLPHLHVADTVDEPGYMFNQGAPPSENAPDPRWMLEDICRRTRIAGGVLSVHRFVRDAIDHADLLQPGFADMQQGITEAMQQEVQNADAQRLARKFAPRPGMTLRGALGIELRRDFYLDLGRAFEPNDVTDYLHAASTMCACDLIALDRFWCHRADRARQRLRKGGMTGRLAECFHAGTLAELLSRMENWQAARAQW